MVAPGASWMPIGELSRRIGVSTDLLRKWEQRYAVLKPGRTTGNQRLYSQVDEARLRLMLRHVRSGVPPAQAAELAIGARFRVNPGPSPVARVEHAAPARARILDALGRYDETTADQVFEKLRASSPVPVLIRDVILPLLHEIGERWSNAVFGVGQEHFASGFIHSRLLGLAHGWDRGLGPRALLACPAGEHHTFGLIAFGVSLHQVGWRIVYLGADTPVAVLSEVAEQVKPRLTVVSTVAAERFERPLPELGELAARWPVALAGAGADGALAKRCGAELLSDDPVTAAAATLA